MARVYRVNSPDVVGEVIDGEAVIVNLSNGNYYSLDGAGALIWALLASGHSAEQVAATTRQRFVGDAVEIETNVAGLIDELCRESLISAVETEPIAVAENDLAAEFLSGVTFAAPVLNRYTDMEDLLLVDPVHGNIRRVEQDAQ